MLRSIFVNIFNSWIKFNNFFVEILGFRDVGVKISQHFDSLIKLNMFFCRNFRV